jgi:methionyl-tRNA formyltransferase
MDGIVIYLNGMRGIFTLRELRRREHGVVQAITLPHLAVEGLVADACKELDIPLFGCSNVNEFQGLFRSRPRLGIIAGYPTLFRLPLIELPELGTINQHGGLLPRYRGGSPLNWQMINGETEAWCSVIRVDEGIDTGNVLAEAPVPILAEDTISELQDRTHQLFATLTADLVVRLENGDAVGRVQDERDACYWHQRNDADGRIRWSEQSAIEVHNLVRAITRPYKGAHTMIEGRQVRIYKTELPAMRIRGVPGRVCYLQGIGPYVVCREGVILVREFEIDGGGKFDHGVHLR